MARTNGPFTLRTIAIVACSPADDEILFIVNAAVLSTVTLNAQILASDWLSMFLSSIKFFLLKVIPMISLLYFVIVIVVKYCILKKSVVHYQKV